MQLTSRLARWVPPIALLVTALVFAGYTALLLSRSWPLEDLSIRSASTFGDSFGFLSALFNALAFVLLVWTLLLQMSELRLQRQEMSTMVATQIRQLHISLQKLAMDDPSLAEVWEPKTEGETTYGQRAYVNLMLSHWEMQYRERLLSREQIEVVLTKYLSDNRHFRAFWLSAQTYRNTMSSASEADSREFHRLAQIAFDAGAPSNRVAGTPQ